MNTRDKGVVCASQYIHNGKEHDLCNSSNYNDWFCACVWIQYSQWISYYICLEYNMCLFIWPSIYMTSSYPCELFTFLCNLMRKQLAYIHIIIANEACTQSIIRIYCKLIIHNITTSSCCISIGLLVARLFDTVANLISLNQNECCAVCAAHSFIGTDGPRFIKHQQQY